MTNHNRDQVPNRNTDGGGNITIPSVEKICIDYSETVYDKIRFQIYDWVLSPKKNLRQVELSQL